ncbi:MAG: citryl-CoA lyase [Candidatus Micrarchaeota archaeon]|nr:citryl-CoA lyase [Candidatus Micrarchaeota archaeon]
MSEKTEKNQKSEAPFKTAISQHVDEASYVRGYALTDLIGKVTFTEQIYLLLKGELPTKEQRTVLDAMLVACAEHRINVPSIVSARYAYSAGNTFNSAMAAGMLSIGDFHGGAIDNAAKMFIENVDKKEAEMVAMELKAAKKRAPGYGHKVYTTDPRSAKLFEVAKQNKLYGKYCKFAESLEAALEKTNGRKLCLNVDGAVAALLCELQIDYRFGKGFFALARCAGIAAHVLEEAQIASPFRTLVDEDVEYTGVKKRELKR